MESGTVVRGRYQLGELVGQGGMGTVFSALDRETGARVAIKLLRPTSLAGDPAGVERFLREGEALRLLDHPNIVKVLAMFEEGDRHYLVMELVEGGSLESLLRSGAGPLPLERVLAIALDVSDALARAHRLGIVHRDLKPSNVLMALDGTPRLGDFGVAYIASKERLSGSQGIVGTLEYMSPETVTGEPVDARSDIWALGVMLFELLSGRRPFVAAHPAGVVHAILQAAPPDLEALRPDCPTELLDLIYRMLEKDRHQRIPSVRRVGAELERLLARLEPKLGKSEVRVPLQEGSRPGGDVADASGRFGVAAFARTAQLSDAPALAELPAQATPFVGRERELAELARLLLDPAVRLVTIVGPGGMGKSRFAIETGQRLARGIGAFAATLPGGAPLASDVLLVELGALASADLVPSAIAEALGFQFYPGGEPKAQLLQYLQRKSLLLVLDNFEHVLEAAGLVNEILQTSPHLKVLATSRERLGLSRETVFALAGMAFPETNALERVDEFSGVRLFVESAKRVKLDFELSDEAAREAVRICRLVQGLPLGIVLAASWANVLSPGEIADEIAASYEFLSTELVDVPERQHSIRTVFDHSYELLAPEERAVFARLAIFRGGFARAAAERVASASLRTLSSLLNKSLIWREPTSGRYRIHELLRQYAESRLALLPEGRARTADAHAAYYATFLSERAGSLKGKDPQLVAGEIEAELDNVRAAWARLLETGDLSNTSAALETLRLFFSSRGAFAQAEETFKAAVASLAEPPPERGSERARLLARALSLQAQACGGQWRHAQAVSLSGRALDLLDERTHPGEAGHALMSSAVSAFWLNDEAGGTELHQGLAGAVQFGMEAGERALRLYRQAADPWETAGALTQFAGCQEWIGNARAEAYLRESIALQRSLPDGVVTMAESLVQLGDVMAERGEYGEGCRLMLEGLALIEVRGDAYNKLLCLQSLTSAERRRGNYINAEAYARRSLTLAREAFPFVETWSHVMLADLLKEQACLDEAVFHYRAAMTGRNPLANATATMNLGDVAFLRGERVEAARALTQGLAEFEQLGASWGIIVARDYLGYLAVVERRFGEAGQHFQRALEHWLSDERLPLALNVLAGVACWYARQDQLERAVELLSLVEHHPITERQTRARRVEPLLAELSPRMEVGAFEAAKARGRALELGRVIRELVDTM